MSLALSEACLRGASCPPEAAAGRLLPGDEVFLHGVRQAHHVEPVAPANWALLLMLMLISAAAAWATLAQVDIIARAQGRVVSEAREQVISNLEGGIVSAISVREGDLVEAGQTLMQLDPTRMAAQQGEGQMRRAALLGSIARLSAEAGGRALAFPPEVRKVPAVVAAETEAYQARRRLLDEAAAMSRRSIVLAENELDTARQMATRGLMSEVEVMRLQRQRNDLQQQLDERINRFRQDASTELARAQAELAQLGEQQIARDDALRRTTLTAPVRGVVKNIHVHTLGGVVAAGTPVMEIVPLGSSVLVEAQVRPADIGFVRTGQTAVVKLSAYDYYTYGGLQGTVEYLSPDALGEEGKPGSADATYYRARIRTDAAALRGPDGRALQVLPGMSASVEIRTGERSVLDYLLHPVMKGREAFRER